MTRRTPLACNVLATTALTSLALLLAAPPAIAADWPQFRGPGGQGHAGDDALPLHWSETRGRRLEDAAAGPRLVVARDRRGQHLGDDAPRSASRPKRSDAS